jgi:hypothetical protein
MFSVIFALKIHENVNDHGGFHVNTLYPYILDRIPVNAFHMYATLK